MGELATGSDLGEIIQCKSFVQVGDALFHGWAKPSAAAERRGSKGSKHLDKFSPLDLRTF